MDAWNKRLEGTGKRALARMAARVFRRPAPTLPAGLRRVLLVRIDDRMGEALLTAPLALALKGLQPAPVVDALVHEKTARVLDGHPAVDWYLRPRPARARARAARPRHPRGPERRPVGRGGRLRKLGSPGGHLRARLPAGGRRDPGHRAGGGTHRPAPRPAGRGPHRHPLGARATPASFVAAAGFRLCCCPASARHGSPSRGSPSSTAFEPHRTPFWCREAASDGGASLPRCSRSQAGCSPSSGAAWSSPGDLARSSWRGKSPAACPTGGSPLPRISMSLLLSSQRPGAPSATTRGRCTSRWRSAHRPSPFS